MSARTLTTAAVLALCLAPGATALAGNNAGDNDGECSSAGASKAVHDVHELVTPLERFEKQFGRVECAVDRVEGDGR